MRTPPLKPITMNQTNLELVHTALERLVEQAASEHLYMERLGDYLREIKPRRVKNLTQALMVSLGEKLGEAADLLVLQCDPLRSPRVVYLVFAEVPGQGRVGLPDEECERVRALLRASPFPLSFVTVTLTNEGGFSTAEVGPLQPGLTPEDDPSA